MIIDNRVQAATGAYANSVLAKQKAVKQEAAAGLSRDEIVLSTEAQSFSQILQKAQSMPEVRQDKVDTYASQIHSGSYQVDSMDLAGKILDTRF